MNFSQRRTQIANIRETPQRPLGIYQHYMRVQGLEADDNGGGNAPTDGRPSKGTSREFLEALPRQIAMLHGGDAAGVDPPATRPVFAFPSTDSCRNRTCDMGLQPSTMLMMPTRPLLSRVQTGQIRRTEARPLWSK